MTTSYATLTTPVTQAAYLSQILATLAAQGFPVTAWQAGNAGRTLATADAAALAAAPRSAAPSAASSVVRPTGSAVTGASTSTRVGTGAGGAGWGGAAGATGTLPLTAEPDRTVRASCGASL